MNSRFFKIILILTVIFFSFSLWAADKLPKKEKQTEEKKEKKNDEPPQGDYYNRNFDDMDDKLENEIEKEENKQQDKQDNLKRRPKKADISSFPS